MGTLRGALVGCGFWSQNHLHAWNQIDDVEMAALCDIDPAKVKSYAEQFSVEKTYNDFEELLKNEQLDFVDIVTQPDTHRPLVELAAKYKVNTICQKPLAPSFADAKAMVEACSQAGVLFMVHENFRWQTPMRRVLDAAQDIGQLFFGRVQFRSGYDVFSNQPYLAEDPIFIIYDLGPHLFDLARFFLGDVLEIFCCTQRINPNIKAEDVATALLKMKSGATCVVEISYASQLEDELFPQTLISLEGDKGSIHLGPHFQVTHVCEGEVDRFEAKPKIYEWTNPTHRVIQESVYAIQQHWVECLQTDIPPETRGDDNLKTIELVFGAYQSAELGTPYKVTL